MEGSMVIVSYSMLFQHFSAPMAYWLMGSTCFSRVIIEPINILQHSRIQLSSTAQTVVTSQNGPRRSEKKTGSVHPKAFEGAVGWRFNLETWNTLDTRTVRWNLLWHRLLLYNIYFSSPNFIITKLFKLLSPFEIVMIPTDKHFFGGSTTSQSCRRTSCSRCEETACVELKKVLAIQSFNRNWYSTITWLFTLFNQQTIWWSWTYSASEALWGRFLGGPSMWKVANQHQNRRDGGISCWAMFGCWGLLG